MGSRLLRITLLLAVAALGTWGRPLQDPAAAAPAPSAAAAAGTGTTTSSEATSSNSTYFIFGYGSLLNMQSTQKTNCQLGGWAEGTLAGFEALVQLASKGEKDLMEALQKCAVSSPRAVRVSGLRKGFFAPVLQQTQAPVRPWPGSAFNPSYTALGALFEEGYNTTGLVYEVDEEEYKQTLERESAGGYAVEELSPADITVLGGPALPAGATIAIFASKPGTTKKPSKQVPLAMSYVDIWLTGAIQVQGQFQLEGDAYRAACWGRYGSFLEETIKTTNSWSSYWLNDRTTPLRPYVQSPSANAIDDAMWKWVPHSALKGMRFPGQAWEEWQA